MTQRFINNFNSQFVGPVAASGAAGALGFEVLQLAGSAAGQLVNPAAGDYYMLTAFKRSGNVESFIEIMKVTAVDAITYPGEVRITVQRGQEGTTAQSYVANDYVSLRPTAGSVAGLLQKGDNLSDLQDAAAARDNLGLGALATADSVENITGNAGTADKLKTARNIDGVAFDGSAAIAVIAPATHAATAKATLVDADELPIADSAATFGLKKVSVLALVTYFLAAARTFTSTLTVQGLLTASAGVKAAGSANSITVAGSAASAPVTLTVDGTDPNVGLNIITKGTGTLTVNGAAVGGGGGGGPDFLNQQAGVI